MPRGRKSEHTKNLESVFKNRKILVTGGTGSIGSALVRRLILYKPAQIRIYSRDEAKHYLLQKELENEETGVDFRFLIGDIRDKERLDKAFGDVDFVFHAAALKHVPFCEYNPFEAIKTNVNGAQNLIDIAHKHNVKKVVAISTDKAVYPNTMMGITKLLMERMIASARGYAGDSITRFAVVRFGNVFGSRGSVVPLWLDQIGKGGPVTVTDKKMMRFLISIEDAAKLAVTAIAIMIGEEVFTFKMPEVNIYRLAEQTIKKHSMGKKIPIHLTGAREREKMNERLFSDEEEKLMIERGPFRIIFPSEQVYKRRENKYTQKWIKDLKLEI